MSGNSFKVYTLGFFACHVSHKAIPPSFMSQKQNNICHLWKTLFLIIVTLNDIVSPGWMDIYFSCVVSEPSQDG